MTEDDEKKLAAERLKRMPTWRPEVRVPDGWQLVPKNLTLEMYEAGKLAEQLASLNSMIGVERARHRWAKQLATAPTYSADQEDDANADK